jgi:hypothetical protein
MQDENFNFSDYIVLPIKLICVYMFLIWCVISQVLRGLELLSNAHR